MLYSDLYKTWEGRRNPSATTARMVRTVLKYVAGAVGKRDWKQQPVISEQQAIVLLDGAMSKTELGSQSKSNYRNYLRRLYRFASEEGISLDGAGDGQLWPPAPNHESVPRRAQVAYDRFVKWAIGRAIWPATVKAQDILDWALVEKNDSNLHWRKDYARLQTTWNALKVTNDLQPIDFRPLPPPKNEKYALPMLRWPANLRGEWQRMCRDASAPLRKGGMRPWRKISQKKYQHNLAMFLGWFTQEHSTIQLTGETWGTLLSADYCQDYLNWQVSRSGNIYLNPGHTAFLRLVRGFHRFLLNSSPEVVQSFTDLCKRCEVEERDKAVRMALFPVVDKGFRQMLAEVMDTLKPGRRAAIDDNRMAKMQVDAIIFGILTTRALRCANVIGIRINKNLVRTADGFELKFAASEMKGHKKFETVLPDELVPVVDDYLAHGYQALTGRMPSSEDPLLLSRRGTPLDAQTFGNRVRRITLKYVGKCLHPHLFRHIVATHAAQVWKMSPTELAALLAHRSVMTVMKYYEVTNPKLAAQRFDAYRQASST